MTATGATIGRRAATVDASECRVTRSRRPRRATPFVVVGGRRRPRRPAGARRAAADDHTLVDVFVLLTMATMWNLLAGYAGLVSVGQQAFIGLGAYIVLILAQWGIQPFLALPLAALGCAVAGAPDLVAPAPPARRLLRDRDVGRGRRGPARHQPLPVARRRDREPPCPGVASIDPATRLAWTYWAALAVAVVARWRRTSLLRGRLGLVLTAVRDDEIGARSVGGRVALGEADRLPRRGRRLRRGRGAPAPQPAQRPGRRRSFSVQWSAKMIFVDDHRRHRLDRGPDRRDDRLLRPPADARPVRGLVLHRARAGRDRGRPVGAARHLGLRRRPGPPPAVPDRLLAVVGPSRPASERSATGPSRRRRRDPAASGGRTMSDDDDRPARRRPATAATTSPSTRRTSTRTTWRPGCARRSQPAGPAAPVADRADRSAARRRAGSRPATPT